MDRLLDQYSAGPLYLQRPDIAQMVVEAIQYRHPAQYLFHSFVVMPNHVHMLIIPKVPVAEIMQSLKRFTARQANRIPGMTGSPFWQDESYDRLVRTDDEFDRIARYIEMSPVHAGLVTEPEQFPWSHISTLKSPLQVGQDGILRGVVNPAVRAVTTSPEHRRPARSLHG
jgi:REP element-mobilizing transposase RayT